MHTDPIADMLTRIRNAQAVRKTTVVIPFSRVSAAVVTLLQEHGFIHAMHIDEFVSIKVILAYDKNKKPKIQHIKRISKPGRRIYVSSDNLPRVLNDYGIAILSTNQGLLTNKQARSRKIGGEVICEVY